MLDFLQKILPRHFGMMALTFRRGCAVFAFFLLLLTGLTLVFSLYSYTMPQDSDSACSLLAGAEIARGNLLLRDWYLCHVSYYFTDLLPYGIAMALVGFKRMLLFVLPSFYYALLIVLLTAMATLRVKRGRCYFAWLGALGLAGLLAVPPLLPGAYLCRFYMTNMLHVGIAIYLLLAILCVMAYRKMPVAASLVLFLLNFMGYFSDTLWLVYWVVPLAALTVCREVFAKRSFNWYFLILSLLGAGAGAAALKGVEGNGFRLIHLDYAFLRPEIFGDRLRDLTVSLLNIFGANPCGRQLREVPLETAGLLFLIFTVVMICGFLPIRRHFGRSMLGLASLALVAVVGASYGWTPGEIRYFFILAPFVFFLLISGLVDLKEGRLKLAAMLAVAVFLGVNGLFLAKSIRHKEWREGNGGHYMLVDALKRERLTCGIGEFWKSNIVTALSCESIRVRPYENELPVRLFRWWARGDWEQERFEFILLLGNWQSAPEQERFWRSQSRRVTPVGDVRIYIFRRPMTGGEINAAWQSFRQR